MVWTACETRAFACLTTETVVTQSTRYMPHWSPFLFALVPKCCYRDNGNNATGVGLCSGRGMLDTGPAPCIMLFLLCFQVRLFVAWRNQSSSSPLVSPSEPVVWFKSCNSGILSIVVIGAMNVPLCYHDRCNEHSSVQAVLTIFVAN